MSAASFHNPNTADEWFHVEATIQADIRDAEEALRDLEPGSDVAKILQSLPDGTDFYNQTVDIAMFHLQNLLVKLDNHRETAKKFRKNI